MVVIARELRLFASPQPGAPVRSTSASRSRTRCARCADAPDRVAAPGRAALRRGPGGRHGPIRLEQVFVNLLGNAFDSLSEGGGGRVTVELRKAPADAVTVRVCDEGAGIPEELLERVFEPFFTTKAYGKGAGLGLAISRSIVQALGGALGVTSAPGQGTAFTVTLPAWRPPVETPEQRAPLSDRRLRVLVVNDEAGIGRALATFLQNHEVVVTRSAPEALAQNRARRRVRRHPVRRGDAGQLRGRVPPIARHGTARPRAARGLHDRRHARKRRRARRWPRCPTRCSRSRSTWRGSSACSRKPPTSTSSQRR